MTIFLLLTASVFFGTGAYKYYLKEKELDTLRSLSHKVLETNRHMYRTLATGLYYRFRSGNGDKGGAGGDNLSSTLIQNNPYEFEYFVGDILEALFGGQTFVTQGTGDYGVDMEHPRKDGLYLIQVKCSKEDVSLDPIAMIHSQVIAQHAKGGIVVTTGGFTPGARQYAKKVGVELIDGMQLVYYWSQYLQKQGQLLENSLESADGLKPALS